MSIVVEALQKDEYDHRSDDCLLDLAGTGILHKWMLCYLALGHLPRTPACTQGFAMCADMGYAATA